MFSFFLSFFLLSSCEKQEQILSCDPNVHNWAESNLQKYADASRFDLGKLTLEQQKALMSGFTGEHKVALWLEKYNYLLTIDSIPENEKHHLSKLFLFITPLHFDDEQKHEELKLFLQTWQEEAELKFGWKEKEFFLYASTLFTFEEFNKYVENKQNQLKGDNNEFEPTTEKFCECLYTISCEPFQICEKSASSCTSIEGCGLLGSSRCTGICD